MRVGRKLRRYLLCAGAVSVAWLGAGCGDGDDGIFANSSTPTSSPVATRQLTLRHDVVQENGPATGLGSQHAAMKVSFLTASGRPVGDEQVVRSRSFMSQSSSSLIPAETIVDRPLDAESVHIDYLSQSGEKIGDTTVPLAQADTLEMLGNPTAPVHFARSGSRFALIVNDQPMVVKGVGFDYTLGGDSPNANDTNWFSYVDPDIAKSGANVIRTYGVGWNFATPQQQTQILSAMLSFAAANSTPDKPIMVLAGLVFDPGQGDMSTLIPQTTALLQSDPNYSHLLGWVVGNENSDQQYPQIDSVVKIVKAQMTSDALVRPVTHAAPTVSAGQVAKIQQTLPSIDWLGINTFYGQYDAAHKGGGFLDIQASSLAQGGWDKPWAITEYYSYDIPSPGFGSVAGMPSQNLNGHDYYLELNSTLNAANYTRSYQDYIVSDDAIHKGSVGGLALNWGPPHNSKLIAFWKTMYAYRGEFKPFVNPPYSEPGADRLESAFAVATMYGGSLGLTPPQIVLPADGDPQGIDCSFKATLETNPAKVAPGTALTASVIVSSSSTLTFDWYLVGGTAEGFSGNINGAQKDPQNYIDTTTVRLGSGSTTQATSGSRSTINFQAPAGAAPGNVYQLRVVARDGQGGAATASIAFPMQ